MNTKLLSVVLLLAAVPAFATTADQVEQVLQRKDVSARRAQQAKAKQTPEVSLTFEWEQKNLVQKARYRIGRVRRRMYWESKHNLTTCSGVVINGRVLTVADCAKNGDYVLKTMQVRLYDGKKINVAGAKVQINGEFAFAALPAALIKQVPAVAAGIAPKGADLESAYGAEVNNAAAMFFLSHGVLSPRANRSPFGIKKTMKRGTPFFYKGKVVALCSYVPKYLPVGWHSSPEDALAVLRVDNGADVLKK